MIGIHGKTIRHFETAIIIERFFYLSRGAENRVGEYELYLNITIESYDMITSVHAKDVIKGEPGVG